MEEQIKEELKELEAKTKRYNKMETKGLTSKEFEQLDKLIKKANKIQILAIIKEIERNQNGC